MRYLLLLLVLCTGCYTRPLADKQTNKAHQKYPDLVRDKFRGWYPCINQPVDSSAYVAARDRADSILAVLDQGLDSLGTLTGLVDSLRRDSAAARNCLAELQAVYQAAQDLDARNVSLRALVKKLQDAPDSGPVIQRVIDSSVNQSAREAVRLAGIERDKFDAQYQAEHSARIEAQNALRGGFRFPWWLAIVLAVLGTLGVVLWLKR